MTRLLGESGGMLNSIHDDTLPETRRHSEFKLHARRYQGCAFSRLMEYPSPSNPMTDTDAPYSALDPFDAVSMQPRV